MTLDHEDVDPERLEVVSTSGMEFGNGRTISSGGTFDLAIWTLQWLWKTSNWIRIGWRKLATLDSRDRTNVK